MRASAALLLVYACGVGRWESVPAEHPVSRHELSFLRVTVFGPPALAQAMAEAGFHVVDHPAWHEDLELHYAGRIATLSSDGYFVDEIRGDDPREIAQRLARSKRVADFVRDSGTVQQRENPGM